MAYKQADPYDRQGMWDISIVLDQEAIRLAPTEDFYYLFLGRALMEKGKASPVQEREIWLGQSEQALLDARAIEPEPIHET